MVQEYPANKRERKDETFLSFKKVSYKKYLSKQVQGCEVLLQENLANNSECKDEIFSVLKEFVLKNETKLVNIVYLNALTPQN